MAAGDLRRPHMCCTFVQIPSGTCVHAYAHMGSAWFLLLVVVTVVVVVEVGVLLLVVVVVVVLVRFCVGSAAVVLALA